MKAESMGRSAWKRKEISRNRAAGNVNPIDLRIDTKIVAIQVDPLTHFFHPDLGLQCDLLRTDLVNVDVPGNKWFKMKYNIEEMRRVGLNELVTFGGAFSNHIAAVASAGEKYGFGTTGVIRGESSSWNNTTLSKAESQGMKLKFIDRITYREWKKGKVNLDDFLGMKDYYKLPEGGSNVLAVKGCSEILDGIDAYDVIACPVGSGGTLAGLIVSASENLRILGFSSLKGGEFLSDDIGQLLLDYDKTYGTTHRKKSNWKIVTDYHFGGFAKMNSELVDFFMDFEINHNIELDLIYTSKMMLGLRKMSENGELENGSRILAVHTGGQQGNESMFNRWGKG
ncbi:MAG TPA: 1-aminocyclopropane-1-carboxylate deaminase [Flavobacteriales bacterium]|nr:1-aminocyclopropane-1-carboxylate deaminase [Flavobacteriales bacterium]